MFTKVRTFSYAKWAYGVVVSMFDFHRSDRDVTIYSFVFKRSISRKLLIMLSINNNKMKVLIIRMKKCWYFIIKLFIVEENILTIN